MKKRTSLAERFWSKVEKNHDCWLWRGAIGRDGYGSFHVSPGVATPAHRMSYTLTHGAIPNGLFILHSCDNKECVNPSHLRIGTHAENMAERSAKKRYAVHSSRRYYSEQQLEYMQKAAADGMSCLRISKVLGHSAASVRATLWKWRRQRQ